VVPADTRTESLKKSLIRVLSILKKLHPKAAIRGHRDFSRDNNGNGIVDAWERIKESPCFDAIPEYQGIK
jgi:N-acetylmuramoyl-L-alanine amidase